MNTRVKHYPLLVAAVLVATVSIYWGGLHGPALLDDWANLLPVSQWLAGHYSWSFVAFGNHSGLLGRPLSMATFLIDAALMRSMATFGFKLTNLIIHLLCGLALLWLATTLFRRWNPTRCHAQWYALGLATVWLWLPLNVDTVLYIVQRMAQLAALFMLLALACFMTAREQITLGKRRGQFLLWIGVPALTLLATLSKENGILALPLAWVLEVFLFRDGSQVRPRSIRLFFALTLALPLLVVCAYAATHPAFVLGGYSVRDFTLEQRLLTEPRILWHYTQTLLVPLGPYMGFFQDNFPASTGWLSPWTTLPSIAAWCALAAAGWLWRKRNPLFGAGVWCYLVGQSIESGPFSLELYFEHRNYLPSFGILVAVASLLVWAWRQVPNPTRAFRHASIALVICVLGLYAAATWSHVQGWRSAETFQHAQSTYNPASPRFQAYSISLALEHHDARAALALIDSAERSDSTERSATLTLWRLLAYCSTGVSPPESLYAQFARRAHGGIDIPTELAMDALANAARMHCNGLDFSRIAPIIQSWLTATLTPSTSETVWRSRSALARIVAANGNLRDARDIMRHAWIDSRYNGELGIVLFQMNGSLGDVKACHRVLAKLSQQQGRGNLLLDHAVARFSKALATGEISEPQTPPPQQNQR